MDGLRIEVVILFQALFHRLFPGTTRRDSPFYHVQGGFLPWEERCLIAGLEGVDSVLHGLPRVIRSCPPPHPITPSRNPDLPQLPALGSRGYEEVAQWLLN